MLRKKYAANVKLQTSINESLVIVQASSTPSVRKEAMEKPVTADHNM